MELAFQTDNVSYLSRILDEICYQEETGETIVPDSYPDMASIVDSHAVVLIRGKDCRKGSVTISGGIKGGILYLPEDLSNPRSLDFYLPFTTKIEHPSLSEQSQVYCEIRICSVDGRIINSRKAHLRVNLETQIQVYEKTAEDLYNLADYPDCVQLRKAVYPVQLPLETDEKSFMISEELSISAGQPPIHKIYKMTSSLKISDQKMVGNKVVFRGTAHCRILYLSPNLTLHTIQQHIPFSQYCECTLDRDDVTVNVSPLITGFDVELDNQDEASHGQLTLYILAQCMVCGKMDLSVIEDAYCTQGTLDAQWHTYQMESFLDSYTNTERLHVQMKEELAQILDVDVYMGFPKTTQCQGFVSGTVPVSVHVLGQNEDGIPRGVTAKTEAGCKLEIHDSVHCDMQARQVDNVTQELLSDGAEVRLDITMECTSRGGQKIRSMKACQMEKVQDPKQPALILQRVTQGTALWDIAKQSSSRKEIICNVNGLEQEEITEDRFLLIPVG